MGGAGGRRLYELLKERYYWSGMCRDCIAICTDSVPSQVEAAKFPPPLLVLIVR